ncbi:MAG: prepilin peptidase [Bdellovibrionales bacterium]
MFFSPFLEFLLPTLLLVIALVDDLRSRKIHNKLLLILLPIVLVAVFLLKGFVGLKLGLFAALLAMVLGVPLYSIRLIGGGDLKLLIVFALTVDIFALSYSFIYSLFWALILGVVKIILDKKIHYFLSNLLLIFTLKNKKIEKEALHTLPFSVAFLFGWLSYYSYNLL